MTWALIHNDLINGYANKARERFCKAVVGDKTALLCDKCRQEIRGKRNYGETQGRPIEDIGMKELGFWERHDPNFELRAIGGWCLFVGGIAMIIMWL